MSALIQGTHEWLQMRKHNIGASDCPIIMGVSPWKTPYQLWEEKLDISKPDLENFAMRRGKEMEAQAREAFEKKTGLIMFPVIMFHPKNEWMLASLDGMDIEQRNIVEIKCPGEEDHKLAMEGRIPDKYYPQLQHQMEVCGLDHVHYYSYREESQFIVDVYRDQNYIDQMIEKELVFLECMQTFVAPEFTDRDYVTKEDELWALTAKQWISVKRAVEDLELQEKELRNHLIYMSGQVNCKGSGIKLSKVVRRGAIDYHTIPEMKGVDCEKYRKPPVESWRLSKNR